MTHSHPHEHSVGHPSGANGYKTVVTHEHPHEHAKPHSEGLVRHAMHKHDAKNNPRSQAAREWREASNRAGSVLR